MSKLNELPFSYEIAINPDLRYFRSEERKKGIKWMWGFTHDNQKKLMYAYYPKEHFTRDDMKRIMKKYKDCPNCKIGGEKKNENGIHNYALIGLILTPFILLGISIIRQKKVFLKPKL